MANVPPSEGGALPTLYQGVLYRSRTEARWACLFNHIGIEFQYEPQGFRVDTATCYLPDFFLPVVRTWAEVKPTEFSPEERRKLEGVADRTGRPALFLVGHPGFKSYQIVYPRDIDLVDPQYSTTVLDIEGIGQRAYSQGRWFTEVPAEWMRQEFFSEEYRHAVFEALTNRFTEGGRW